MMAHNVYFTLKDNSAAERKRLMEACKKYLAGQPGVLFFACGPRSAGCTRDVNDQDFDVSLHLVFRHVDDHDRYQADPTHGTFSVECKGNWAKVRASARIVEGATHG